MTIKYSVGSRIQVWGPGTYQHRHALRDMGFDWDRQSKVWHAALTPYRKYVIKWVLMAECVEIVKELPSHPTGYRPALKDPTVRDIVGVAMCNGAKVWMLAADGQRTVPKTRTGVDKRTYAAIYEDLGEGIVTWVLPNELDRRFVFSRLYSRAELLAMNEGVPNGN